MGLKPENKGIALIAIGTAMIIASLYREWHIVNAGMIGLFALLKLE